MSTEEITCTRCRKRKAQYFRLSSGEKLCLECLFKSIEYTVLRTIRNYRLIVEGDRVGIAVSGGKDSLVLLYILAKFKRQRKLPKNVELIAFTINEGHPYSCYYRYASRRDFVVKLCSEVGIEYRVYHFKDIFGFSADEIAQNLVKNGYKVHMCTICGVLRRKAMNIIGKELRLTKIAVGHNIDDEAQTVLLNVFNNDVKRFAWFGPKPLIEHEEEFIPRIKPLRFLREEEIAIYAHYHGIPLLEIECPFVYVNPRYKLKFILAKLEKLNPNIKYSIVAFGDTLAQILQNYAKQVKLSKCKYCGELTSSSVCRACDLFEKAKNQHARFYSPDKIAYYQRKNH